MRFSFLLTTLTTLATLTSGCATDTEEDAEAAGAGEAISGAKTKILASAKFGDFISSAASSRGFYVAGYHGDIQLFTPDGAPPKVVVHRPEQQMVGMGVSEDAIVWWDSFGQDLHGAALDGSNDVVIMHGRGILCSECTGDTSLRGMMPDWLRSHYMSAPSDIVVRGKDVYFADDTAHVYHARADQADSFEPIVALRDGTEVAGDDCLQRGMAADGANVYVATLCRSYGQIERIELGSKRRTILDSVTGTWSNIGVELVLDHDTLTYFARRSDGAELADGTVPFTAELRRVPVAGGTPQVIATIDDGVPGLALIGGAFYTAQGRSLTPGTATSAPHQVIDVVATPAGGGPTKKVTTLAPSPDRSSVYFYANEHGLDTDGRALYMLAQEDAPDGIHSHVLLIDTH